MKILWELVCYSAMQSVMVVVNCLTLLNIASEILAPTTTGAFSKAPVVRNLLAADLINVV
jgi:hypothetical protein